MRHGLGPVLVAATLLLACQDIEGAGEAGSDAAADAGGSADARGGGAGGGGGGGAGGGGAPGPEPDGGEGGGAEPPPDCDGRVGVQIGLPEDRLYARGEAVEVQFQVRADGPTTQRFSADRGGRFVPRDDRVFWSAGDVEPDDVAWPWRTGPVQVTVTARDARGCMGHGSVAVRLAGDVLVAEGTRGYLFALGSDGRRLGRYVQVAERGLRGLAPLPRAEGGGLLVAVRPSDDRPPAILRLDPDGRRVTEMEMRDVAGEPIFPDDRHAPLRVVWDPVRREVLADNAPGGRVHRWRLTGEHVGVLTIPGTGVDHADRPLGFAVLGDGTVVAGHDGYRRIYALRLAGPELFAELPGNLGGLGAAHGGGLIASQQSGNDVLDMHFDANGRELRSRTAWGYAAVHLTRFRDGYLSTDATTGAVRYMHGDLSVPEAEESPWRQRYDLDDLSTATGVLWLHDD